MRARVVPQIIPALVQFDPDLVLISAGFDAHRKDDINFKYIGVQVGRQPSPADCMSGTPDP